MHARVLGAAPCPDGNFVRFSCVSEYGMIPFAKALTLCEKPCLRTERMAAGTFRCSEISALVPGGLR